MPSVKKKPALGGQWGRVARMSDQQWGIVIGAALVVAWPIIKPSLEKRLLLEQTPEQAAADDWGKRLHAFGYRLGRRWARHQRVRH